MESKKKVNWEFVVFICLIGLIIFFICCGLSASNPKSKCLAISPFGKLEIMGIDKAVITVDGETVTVTDTELLNRIVDETKVATEAVSCDHGLKDRTIDLYRGDKLVRSMKWYDCQDLVRVYDADLTHWIFSPATEAGYVELSKELVKDLEALF